MTWNSKKYGAWDTEVSVPRHKEPHGSYFTFSVLVSEVT